MRAGWWCMCACDLSPGPNHPLKNGLLYIIGGLLDEHLLLHPRHSRRIKRAYVGRYVLLCLLLFHLVLRKASPSSEGSQGERANCNCTGVLFQVVSVYCSVVLGRHRSLYCTQLCYSVGVYTLFCFPLYSSCQTFLSPISGRVSGAKLISLQ